MIRIKISELLFIFHIVNIKLVLDNCFGSGATFTFPIVNIKLLKGASTK
ncbi:hypothetical protein Q3309_08285 [Clostridioides difficile]